MVADQFSHFQLPRRRSSLCQYLRFAEISQCLRRKFDPVTGQTVSRTGITERVKTNHRSRRNDNNNNIIHCDRPEIMVQRESERVGNGPIQYSFIHIHTSMYKSAAQSTRISCKFYSLAVNLFYL